MISVPVLFSFGRSGGTLVNQLLGTHPDCSVLSEVNPAASFKPLVEQAVEWLRLVAPAEAGDFGLLPYADQLHELRERALRCGRRLVVRDWTSVNFVPGCSPCIAPSTVLEQPVYLRLAGLRVKPLVIARRGREVFRSWKRTFDHFQEVDAREFSRWYLQYAKAVSHYPIVRLESVQADPRRSVSEILAIFDLPKEPLDIILRNFHSFRLCTGNRTLDRPTKSSLATTILKQEPEELDQADLDAQFKEADILLGYDQD